MKDHKILPDYLNDFVAQGDWIGLPAQISVIPGSSYVLVQTSKHFLANRNQYRFNFDSQAWELKKACFRTSRRETYVPEEVENEYDCRSEPTPILDHTPIPSPSPVPRSMHIPTPGVSGDMSSSYGIVSEQRSGSSSTVWIPYHETGSLDQQTSSFDHQTGFSYHQTNSSYNQTGSLDYETGSLDHQTGFPCHQTGSMPDKHMYWSDTVRGNEHFTDPKMRIESYDEHNQMYATSDMRAESNEYILSGTPEPCNSAAQFNQDQSNYAGRQESGIREFMHSERDSLSVARGVDTTYARSRDEAIDSTATYGIGEVNFDRAQAEVDSYFNSRGDMYTTGDDHQGEKVGNPVIRGDMYTTGDDHQGDKVGNPVIRGDMYSTGDDYQENKVDNPVIRGDMYTTADDHQGDKVGNPDFRRDEVFTIQGDISYPLDNDTDIGRRRGVISSVPGFISNIRLPQAEYVLPDNEKDGLNQANHGPNGVPVYGHEDSKRPGYGHEDGLVPEIYQQTSYSLDPGMENQSGHPESRQRPALVKGAQNYDELSPIPGPSGAAPSQFQAE